ncbi:MAG TPA: holo-ACP synthase [Acidimicrobiales bacterium]|nr:holo-ACP synthase [Acidimicrobiales bacterium]
MDDPGSAPGGVVGVGIDAVDVDRFRAVLRRRPGLAARMFTDRERDDAARSSDPTERLAARFAAKEAVMKALGRGIGSFALRDVEVVRAEGSGSSAGAPSLRLRAGAARLAGERRVGRWHVSLSHTATTAIAMVVAERGAGGTGGSAGAGGTGGSAGAGGTGGSA